jgi:hypothetical protein
MSTFGSGSPYREPWRPWSLVTLADRFFCQGPAQFTVREIRNSALKFFTNVDRIRKDYLRFRGDPVALSLVRQNLAVLESATPMQRLKALQFNLQLLRSGESAQDVQRKLPGVTNAYRIRAAVSKNPLKEPKGSSDPDHVSQPEIDAVISLATGCCGHKYKAGPMVAGDRAEDKSNDMRTQPAVLHCVQGMWNTVIQAASPFFRKLESDYETLLHILAGGDAPGAAHMARRTGAWMASDAVAGRLARLRNSTPRRALLFPIVCLALFTQTAYSPSEFSMLYNFRLWVFAFFSWVTMSDWSQRTAERNATLTLYWSSLFSMCMFSFEYRRTLASINEESGEGTFRAEGIATQTARRKHRLEQARLTRHMKDQIEDRTTHEAARPSHTRSDILHTPMSNVHVHTP